MPIQTPPYAGYTRSVWGEHPHMLNRGNLSWVSFLVSVGGLEGHLHRGE